MFWTVMARKFSSPRRMRWAIEHSFLPAVGVSDRCGYGYRAGSRSSRWASCQRLDHTAEAMNGFYNVTGGCCKPEGTRGRRKNMVKNGRRTNDRLEDGQTSLALAT